MRGRDDRDKANRRALGKPTRTNSSKREGVADDAVPRKRRKLKYVRIDEEWGSGEKGEDAFPFLYSGLEGVTPRGGGNKKISKKALALEGAALLTGNKITAWTQKVGILSSKKCMNRKVCIGVNDLLAIEWDGGSSECKNQNPLTDTT